MAQQQDVPTEGVTSSVQYLPWGTVRERVSFPENVLFKQVNQSGQVVMQMLFAEFAVMADRKIDQVLQHCVRFFYLSNRHASIMSLVTHTRTT